MDCKSEVKMLSELAEKYRAKASSDPQKNWADLLRAHTLYNACAYRTSDKKWMQHIFELQNMYWREDVTSTLDRQILLSRKFQRELSIIRDECRDDLSKVGSLIKNWDCAIDNLHSGHNRQVTRCFCDSLQKISLKTNAKMKVLAGKIIQESVELCGGQPPCKFTAVAMGSLAKGEATPYSDLEFMFLVERKDKDIIKYFELLAMTVYFLIGNIQETKLKYMNIDELKNFDDKCKNGFKIDGLQSKAGNIPTGNGTPEQRNKFILTVSELIDKYRAIYLSPNLQEAAKGDLTSMLAHTSALYGDNGLLNDFKLAKCNIKSNAARRDVHAKMIQADIKDYSFLPLDKLGDQNYSVDLKSAIYRFPSLLIYNLKIICNINSGTSWQTLENLISEEKLSNTFYYWLKFLLASALYIRLAAYLHYDSQNERISFLRQLGSKSSAKKLHANDLWHIPQSLAFHMSVHMIPLKKSIMIKELDEIMKILSTDIQYDRQLVAAHYLCSSKKIVEALEILESRSCDSYVEKHMLAACYMTLKKWKKFQPIVRDILERYSQFSQYLKLFWMFKSATGYNQQGILTTAKVIFDELMNQLDIITEKAGFDDDTQVWWEAYMHAAHFYLRINDGPSAEKYYNKGNVLTETVPQENQGTIIYSHHLKAGWLYNMRRYTEAELVLTDNIKLCQQLYGPDACHESIAYNYRGLGDVYGAIGKLEKSFRCREKARKIMEGCDPLKLEDNNFGEEDINYAQYHENREDFKSALSFYNKALTRLKKGYGTKSFLVPDLYRQIAGVHIKQGNLQHAEEYLKKALSLYTSIDTQYPTDYVAKCHFDMGFLLYQKDCLTEALDHFGWVTSSEVPSVNLNHQDLLCQSFAYTGRIFHTWEDYESAIKNYEKALSVLTKMPVTGTKFIIRIYTELTRCYFQCFNLRAAYIVLKNALRFLIQQEMDYQCCEAECFLIVFSLMIAYFKLSGKMSGVLNLAENQDIANGILKCVGPHGELFFL